MLRIIVNARAQGRFHSPIVRWNLNFAEIYNGQPVAGKKNNNLLLTTGLGITFGGKPK